MTLKESTKGTHLMIPLFQESGVYHFYLEMDVPDSGKEVELAEGEASLESRWSLGEGERPRASEGNCEEVGSRGGGTRGVEHDV